MRRTKEACRWAIPILGGLGWVFLHCYLWFQLSPHAAPLGLTTGGLTGWILYCVVLDLMDKYGV